MVEGEGRTFCMANAQSECLYNVSLFGVCMGNMLIFTCKDCAYFVNKIGVKFNLHAFVVLFPCFYHATNP